MKKEKRKISKKELVLVVSLISLLVLSIGYLVFLEIAPKDTLHEKQSNSSRIGINIPSSKLDLSIENGGNRS